MLTHKINEEISVKECVLIDQDKNNLGKKNIVEARNIADEAGLDLILISENPPVCKILDYQKFLYETKKKIKKQQKPSKFETIKEIKIGVNIQPHDLEIKTKKVKQLVNQGYKVKVFCLLPKRQQALKPNVIALLKDVYDNVKLTQPPEDFIKTSNNLIFGVIS